MATQHRRLPLVLPGDVYKALAAAAAAEDRDPMQQARAIIRRALSREAPIPAPREENPASAVTPAGF